MPSTAQSRFSQRFGLETPICLAPMALASGGELAAACARAGALGLVGGGYGDLEWTRREYALALELGPKAKIGVGFITWKLDENSEALDDVLALKPRAVMLSFGDPRPYAARIKASGADLICQIQRLEQVPAAVEAGASVIVAQGGEAGGHGMNSLEARSTLTLVPEVADYLATHLPGTLLLAAGGIADGRGIAAALCLGADGVLIGSRLWATRECLAPQGAKEASIPVSGDETARSSVFDVLRRLPWPKPYNFRAVRNTIHKRWEGKLEELAKNPVEAREDYDDGIAAKDYERAHVTVGECVGLITDLPGAEELVRKIAAEARKILGED